ncbi:MAG: ATP-dependent endonuclease [Labilithrix sp.]|nr:ATP-dependent endonuclease [Labilithrix sp.]
MQIASIQVRNFKGLRDVNLPASRFVCVIGENNAGKSSIMQAIMRHLDGKKVERLHYYSPEEPIEIRFQLEAIDDDDLARVGPAHRAKIADVIEDGKLTTVRRFLSSGETELKVVRRQPKDESLRRDAFEQLLKGKRAPGLAEAAYDRFPELRGSLTADAKKDACIEAMVNHVASLPEIEMVEAEELPTGIEAGLRGLFPEPIYIPAVRDLSDDMKTKDGASFGKLLSLVLEQLRDTEQVKQIDQFFTLLNHVLNPGAGRLPQLGKIERRLDALLKEQFARADVSLRFPMPDLKTLVSSAIIDVDDGMKAEASTKGDGLRRALTFALIRALVETQLSRSDEDNPARGRYVFLFEEPELYLHPSAQRSLFRALAALSGSHHVFVTTHSPLFFDADKTTTFVKLTKDVATDGQRPFAKCRHVDLSELDQRLRMQAICFENNSIAFFSRAVVLVEGVSDALVIPHLARLVHDDKGFDRTNLALCRVEGKSSIKRYREFFDSFGVRVFVIADLDCMLEEFDKLGAGQRAQREREQLLVTLDDAAAEASDDGTIPGEKLKELSKKTQWRDRWQALKNCYALMRKGQCSDEDVARAGAAFFNAEVEHLRRRVLQTSTDPKVVAAKRQALATLRDDGIFLLERGAIEAYYPPSITGQDKVSKALSFRENVRTRDDAISLCDRIPTSLGEEPEFAVILSQLFGQVDAMTTAPTTREHASAE